MKVLCSAIPPESKVQERPCLGKESENLGPFDSWEQTQAGRGAVTAWASSFYTLTVQLPQLGQNLLVLPTGFPPGLDQKRERLKQPTLCPIKHLEEGLFSLCLLGQKLHD